MSSPRRHGPHSPQEMNGCTITVSPTSTFETPIRSRAPSPRSHAPAYRATPPGLLGPLAFLNMEVRAAQSRRADADDHVERTVDLGLVDASSLTLRGTRAAWRLSSPTSSGSAASPWRTCSSERQIPPFASRLVEHEPSGPQPSLQLLRAHRSAVAGDERGRVGAELGFRVVRGARGTARLGPVGPLGRHRGALGGLAPAAPPHHPSRRRPARGRREVRMARRRPQGKSHVSERPAPSPRHGSAGVRRRGHRAPRTAAPPTGREQFLHWAFDGQEWQLHGRLAPPADGRRRSVTRNGWCPGLRTSPAPPSTRR